MNKKQKLVHLDTFSFATNNKTFLALIPFRISALQIVVPTSFPSKYLNCRLYLYILARSSTHFSSKKMNKNGMFNSSFLLLENCKWNLGKIGTKIKIASASSQHFGTQRLLIAVLVFDNTQVTSDRLHVVDDFLLDEVEAHSQQCYAE